MNTTKYRPQELPRGRYLYLESLKRVAQIYQTTQIHPFPLILSPKQVPTKSYANPIFLPLQGTDLERLYNGVITEGEYRFG